MKTMNKQGLPACSEAPISRRHLIAGGAGLAMAGTGLLTSSAIARQGHSPVQATPEEAGTPTVAGDFPLLAMLGLVPQSFLDAGNGMPYWMYSDFARQFASLGMHHDISGPDFENVPVAAATIALLPGSNAYSYALVEDFTSAIGFQPLGMGQSLVLGDPPEQITMFRGEFDPDALIAAWEASDYEQIDTPSGTVAWTIGPEGEFEFDHPIQSCVIAAMNNVAILDDVLVYANTIDLLNIVLDHVASGLSAAIDDPVWGPVIGTLPETTVSAIALAPIRDWMNPNLDPAQTEAILADLDEVREVAGPMPDATAMIVGVEEGATALDIEWEGIDTPPANAGTMFVRLGTASAEDAEQVASVVVARSESLPSLFTGQPYSELIVPEHQDAMGTTAVVDFTQLESPRVWSSMVLSNDVLLFVPDSAL